MYTLPLPADASRLALALASKHAAVRNGLPVGPLVGICTAPTTATHQTYVLAVSPAPNKPSQVSITSASCSPMPAICPHRHQDTHCFFKAAANIHACPSWRLLRHVGGPAPKILAESWFGKRAKGTSPGSSPACWAVALAASSGRPLSSLRRAHALCSCSAQGNTAERQTDGTTENESVCNCGERGWDTFRHIVQFEMPGLGVCMAVLRIQCSPFASDVNCLLLYLSPPHQTQGALQRRRGSKQLDPAPAALGLLLLLPCSARLC